MAMKISWPNGKFLVDDPNAANSNKKNNMSVSLNPSSD
jgi:hypothetical protein